METYKIIFENYEISDFGNVRRKMNNGEYKTINGSIMNRGYKYFQVLRDGKRINKLIHHLVAEAFIGQRPELFDIDHIDRNKLNNNVENLRYITHKENCRNTDIYRNDLIEPNNRKERCIIRAKDYQKKNKEKISEKKKEYYLKNKDKIKERYILSSMEKIKVICKTCNKEREIQTNSLKHNKTGNCNTCASKENLKIINK